MRIVVASDSFKGSLTSMEVARAVEAAIGTVTAIAMADGGEGTARILASTFAPGCVEERHAYVHDALMRPLSCTYYVSGKRAMMDMASVCGLAQLAPEERNPLRTTTYGLGEMMADALEQGCDELVIGVGGTSTNDGGSGMLQALGAEMVDSQGMPLAAGCASPVDIHSIDLTALNERMRQSHIVLLTDVTSPLCGPQGASSVFGPQKGADEEAVRLLDRALNRYALLMERLTGHTRLAVTPGTGAGGGVAASLLPTAKCNICSGAEYILDLQRFDDVARGADLIVTGEGSADKQTLQGKAPLVVMKRAKALRPKLRVVLMAGRVSDHEELLAAGFDEVIEVTPKGMPLSEAMRPEVAVTNIIASCRELSQRMPH